MLRVAAVDLGATSVRVAVVDLEAETPEVEVVHRWVHGPIDHPDGTRRWDWPGIVAAVEHGLGLALTHGPLASIGVDGWAVDYGLLDPSGALITLPYSYRDTRTEGWQAVADHLGRDDLYDRTGIQLMSINTIFQLAAHDPVELADAARLLLLPDLLVYHLTGHVGVEHSNATTTALVDWRTGDWDIDLLDAVGLRRGQLPPIERAGQRVGTWRGVPVHTVGSHDTASAFLGVPGVPGPGTAIVSSGTWVLVGAERDHADVSPAARAANFSNEGGALGGTRFLTNVMGFWLLERCREAWGFPPVPQLIDLAARVTAEVPVVDLTGGRFLAPDGLEGEFRLASGLGWEAPRACVVRSIIESIVAGTADAVAQLGALTGVPCDEVLHVGGGSRMRLLREQLEFRTGLPVRTGSPEATALGNAIVQGIALETFTDAREARDWVERGSLSTNAPGRVETE